jgi:hypothetical protein
MGQRGFATCYALLAFVVASVLPVWWVNYYRPASMDRDYPGTLWEAEAAAFRSVPVFGLRRVARAHRWHLVQLAAVVAGGYGAGWLVGRRRLRPPPP